MKPDLRNNEAVNSGVEGRTIGRLIYDNEPVLNR